jgi:hypothetical protein
VLFLASRFAVGLLLGGIAALIAAGLVAGAFGDSASGPSASPGGGDDDGAGTVLVVFVVGAVALAAIVPVLGFLRRHRGTAASRPGLTFVDWPPGDQRGEVPVGLSIAALIVGMATGLGGLAIGLVTAW